MAEKTIMDMFADMGKQFLPHLQLPQGAGPDWPDDPFDVDLEFGHASAPKMPPMVAAK